MIDGGLGSCAHCGRILPSQGGVVEACPNCNKNHSCLVALLFWLGGGAGAVLAIVRAVHGL